MGYNVLQMAKNLSYLLAYSLVPDSNYVYINGSTMSMKV